MISTCRLFAAASVALFCASTLGEDYIPKAGEFPPDDAGHYFAGELVAVDHVNRRGAIRLFGDNNSDRYHRAESHRFAMLPYGTVRYRGAPAELRDIPIGTVVHGYFVLPPEGDHTIPPADGLQQKYVPQYSHALSIEDDFSFYQRRGQVWKILEVKLSYDMSGLTNAAGDKEIDWRSKPISGGFLKALLTGKVDENGLSGEQVFTVDRSTRLWRGRQRIDWEDLAPSAEWNREDGHRLETKDATVQIGLTWAPDWQNGQFHVADIWLDDESRKLATETQRQIHIRHVHHRWLPGWVDHVEHQSGGSGIVTVTLFGGMDPSLYEEVKTKQMHTVHVAAGEWTLRTWWQEHDNKGGRIVEIKETADPPIGSSGLQLRVQISDLLAGFARGRIVRLRCHDWPNVKLPPEERVKDMSERVPAPYIP